MILRRSWLSAILSHYFIAIIIIAIPTGIIGDLGCGIIYLFAYIPIIIKMLRDNKVFTPLSPAILFGFAFGVYLLHFTNTEYYMNFVSKIIIVSCIALWEVIAISSKGFNLDIKETTINNVTINKSSFTLIIFLLFCFAVVCMLFEWKMAGGIPALRADQETFRFTVKYSSLVHIIAIMNKIIVAIVGAYFVNKGYISLKKDFVFLLIIIVSELLMFGTAMRGELIMGPAVIFIVYGIKNKIPIKFYLIGFILACIVVGVYPYMRMYMSYGNAYVGDLIRISRYPKIYFMTPLIQTFSNNFSILAFDISIFPEIKEFGYGIYSILPNIPFIDLGASLMDLQNQVLGNNFYAGLTATFLATWFADFGYFGCILGTCIFACWINFVYDKFMLNPNMFTLLWYAYTFYIGLWLFYNNTFDIVYICYSIVFLFVSKIKIKI